MGTHPIFESDFDCLTDMHRIIVVGGGAAGLATAARLARSATAKVKVIDAADKHYYQPIWTLVGGGLYNFADSEKLMSSVIPKGVEHIKANLAGVRPESNEIELENGESVSYDALVLATGLELGFDAVEGLQTALDNDDRVCSNYSPKYVHKTYPAISNFQSGQKAVFTQPPMPFKCAGAPQKIMWIARDEWAQKGIQGDIFFNTATPAIFGVPKYANELMKLVQEHSINFSSGSNLISVNHEDSIATFSDGKELKYDLLHVTPPQRPIKPLREDNQLTDQA